MTRREIYSVCLVALLAAMGMTLAAIIIPRWISWDSGTASGSRIHQSYGLHRLCSSLTNTCKPFPRNEDCHGDNRGFCSMWRSVGFLMSFAVVMEGMTAIAFVIMITAGKQRRRAGWKLLVSLLILTAVIQCAGMSMIAYLYDNDDRFFTGWKLDQSWVLCTTSWLVAVLLAGGLTASALLLPFEGDYELIPDQQHEEVEVSEG